LEADAGFSEDPPSVFLKKKARHPFSGDGLLGLFAS
jgi:hypothetical protein